MTGTVSVVISTFERRDSCCRAVASALAQDPTPLEVLVCDDGSADGTKDVFTAWAREEERIRYRRLPRNSGGPAVPRNLGVREARGDWLAFLDDDDEWLPGKLARQLEMAERVDVVATDALLPDGSSYFDLGGGPVTVPGHRMLLANPVILSSAMARRGPVLEAGGFPVGRSLVGVEDYCLWMAMAERGARFLLLPEPLLRYDDGGADRLSRPAALRQRGVALYALSRWARRPWSPALARAALRHAAGAAALSWRNAELADRG